MTSVRNLLLSVFTIAHSISPYGAMANPAAQHAQSKAKIAAYKPTKMQSKFSKVFLATNATAFTAPITADSLASSYSSLQTVWDGNYSVKGTCGDLLNEGRNAPARKKWVDYYVSSIGQTLSNLQTQYNQATFPSDLQPTLAQPWAEVGSGITDLQAAFKGLSDSAAAVKSPTDQTYPAVFWGPSSEVASTSDKVDKSIDAVLKILDTSRDNALLSQPAAAGSTSSATPGTTSTTPSGDVLKGGASKSSPSLGLSHVADVSRRVRKSCFEFFGELERFNLLYAHPPKGEPANMFYGGAFTKQEVLSQYKYMPNLVFTSAPYVKLFSYRLPPRQAMLATYLGQVGKLLNLMESELNDIQIPPEKAEALAGPWQAVKEQFIDSRNQYLALDKLVNATSDPALAKDMNADQSTFGGPAMAIYDDMQKLLVAINDMNALLINK